MIKISIILIWLSLVMTLLAGVAAGAGLFWQDEDGVSMSSNAKSIIIIGTGMAGLSAGCYAQMNGYHSRIFELLCRADAKATGKSPTLRRITANSSISTKEIFALFPKGPAKKVARISGLDKPEGCV